MTFGVPLTPTNFEPMTNVTINPDPGLFFPPVMIGGVRDVNVYALYGEYKFSGAVDGPIFPVNGIPLFFGGIGQDGGAQAVSSNAAGSGYGVTGSTGGTASTTLSSASLVNATTISTVGNTGISNGTILQIDVNNTSTPTTAECRKVTAISGTGPYTVTLDSALNFSHASGATVVSKVAPFTHYAIAANLLPSYTIEKNLGNYQSEQYAGSRVAKYAIKVAAGKNAADFSAEVMAQTVAVLDTPTVPVDDATAPFVFAEATITLLGTQINHVASLDLTIDNGLKDTYTMNQAHTAQFITPVTRKITGKVSLVFHSLDDATLGYFNKTIVSPVQGNLIFTLAHPSNGGTVQVTLPQVNFSKYVDNVRINEIIMTELDFEASYSLTSAYSVQGQVINSAYLPY